jgi:hypothetical protein
MSITPTFRSPRTIAEEKNDKSMFGGDPPYDPIAGTPSAQAGSAPMPDYSVNPTNPADPPAPAKNLKR